MDFNKFKKKMYKLKDMTSLGVSSIVIPPLFPKFTETIEVIQIISITIIPSTIISAYISKFLSLTKNRIVIYGAGNRISKLIYHYYF